jgi:hypothetical protein
MGDDDREVYPPGSDLPKMPDLQLPDDYYGVEGTWDSSGHWQGGTIHNPLHDVPIPGSLDPDQLLPHHDEHGQQHNPGALSQHQIDALYHSRNLLSEAISLLQNSSDTAAILQNLPTVLTIANSMVKGDHDWEQNLADACRTWIGTQADAGTDDQFHHARDAVVNAGWQVFGETDQWLHQNDAIMMATQGDMALQQLAHTAANAHLQLHPAR